MQSSKMDLLFKKGKYALELLEYYDKTRELLVGRKRIDVTLDKKLILKLKQEAKKKKIPLSRLIESRLKK